MTTFYFVRHAHANWIPDENRPLSESGHKNAEWVADLMQSLPLQYIYSSPYRRAAQTVEPLANRLGLPILTLDDLRERDLAGEAVDDFEAAIKAVWHDPTFAHPDGESNQVAKQRGAQVMDYLYQKHPHDHVALASHGNLLALTLQHFDATIGYDFWQTMSMPDIYQATIVDNEMTGLQRLWEPPD